ncbi:DUF1853 domain-containing protein [Photobacterium sanctipauli]|uniref:DUF1853 domain-containing protein n=2 Tax=Photobacterium sanctipauli TaxID=1342794 RepID=A0A2T3NRI4_9GAMM|nr:DUF1853 domain-containing protein [Photobacterium sanctipauli]
MTLKYNTTKDDNYLARTSDCLLTLPPLLAGHADIADQAWFDSFRTRAVLPSAQAYQGNHRLGFFYQWLWQQLIVHHPDYTLVAEELQLQHNKQTLGAIDFLVKNKISGDLEHWEVAIKFYLACGQSWPGPNAIDNLDKKASRMLDHQLLMSQHPAYENQFAAKYGTPKVRRLIMQGRLFYPCHSSDIGSAIALNPNVATGKWCYSAQAGKLNLRAIGKPDWIAPPTFEQLEDNPPLSQVTHPTMAVAPDNQIWFVMPEHWPNV